MSVPQSVMSERKVNDGTSPPPTDAPYSHSPSPTRSVKPSLNEPSSEWSALPDALLGLLISYSSFRDVLHIALLHRRTYHQLIHGTTAHSTSPSNVWCHYPRVEFVLLYEARERGPPVNGHREVVARWGVQVGDNRFRIKARHHASSYVSSLLSVLRHIRQLHLESQYWDEPRLGVSRCSLHSARHCNTSHISRRSTLEALWASPRSHWRALSTRCRH